MWNRENNAGHLQSRLDKLNDRIKSIASDPDAAALKELNRLKKSLARSMLKIRRRSPSASLKRPAENVPQRALNSSIRPKKAKPSTNTGTEKR